MTALTREDLDAARCSNPGCTHDSPVLEMVACHDAAGLRLYYDKRTGRLSASCFVCNATVLVIAVARSELAN